MAELFESEHCPVGTHVVVAMPLSIVLATGAVALSCWHGARTDRSVKSSGKDSGSGNGDGMGLDDSYLCNSRDWGIYQLPAIINSCLLLLFCVKLQTLMGLLIARSKTKSYPRRTRALLCEYVLRKQ